MSTPSVHKILMALKATVNRNVNSHCWQDSGTSESYGDRVKKVGDQAEMEILNVAGPHFSQCGGATCEGDQCDSLCGGPTSNGNLTYEYP